jgi:hypothetical protein
MRQMVGHYQGTYRTTALRMLQHASAQETKYMRVPHADCAAVEELAYHVRVVLVDLVTG